MGVEKKKFKEKNLNEEMAEWFKAADCKSVEMSHRRFESCFLQYKTPFFEILRSGSVSALGAESHVFESHYFELFTKKF